MRKMWSDEVLEVMLAGKRSNLAMYSARELQLVPARAKQAHFVHQYMNVGRGEDVFERGPLAFRPTIACVHLPHMRLGTQRGAAHPLPLAGARDRTLVLGQMRRGEDAASRARRRPYQLRAHCGRNSGPQMLNSLALPQPSRCRPAHRRRAMRCDAIQPAWFDDEDRSPRDPAHYETPACEARSNATKAFQNPRDEVTELMRAYGLARQAALHW